MAINGKNYDWEDIHVTTLTGEQIGITEIKYSDEQSVTAGMGAGLFRAATGAATMRLRAAWCLTATNGKSSSWRSWPSATPAASTTTRRFPLW